MYRLIVLFALSFPAILNAQTFTEETLDSISFNQFLAKDFKGLKQTIKIATENKIDFYYLHLRAGILAYNSKNYEYAIPHFKKALEFYPADTLSQEYLYYAFLFSDRKAFANEYASTQTISFQQRVHYKKTPFDFIGIGAGAVLSNNINQNQNKSFIPLSNALGKAERTLNGNLYYGDFSFQNTIKNRLHISNYFSGFYNNALDQIEIQQPLRKINYSKNFNNLNFQYNFILNYTTKKEWNISIGLGYYRISSNTYTALRPDSLTNQISIVQNTTKTNSFLGSITIAKRFKNIQPFIQVSASNLNALKQVQTGIGLLYYPLGNYNFYGITNGTYLRNNSTSQYVINQTIGFKIVKCWWTKLIFQYGNLSNFIAQDGITTYNTSDPIKINSGVEFNFYIKKHFQLNAGYFIQQRSNIIETTRQSNLTTTISNSNYLTHFIKTNLIWNF